MAQPLIIEYVLDGPWRGYNYTSPTHGYDDDTLKLIWRTVMPRGQGWGAYAGARSFKCFPVDEGRVALADVTVTDLRDESGRRGIRRAAIDIMSHDACAEHLRIQLENYPEGVRAALEKRPSVGQWKQIIDRALPKLNGSAQVVLAAPLSPVDSWQWVEAVVLKIALSRKVPLRRWGKVVPFTTLALDYREEMRLVAIPTTHIPTGDAVALIHLSP